MPGLLACDPETRIGPSAVFGETRTEPFLFLTSSSHRASAISWPETASDHGRFTQEDPINSGFLRLYAYVSAQPASRVDPDGFCDWEVRHRPMDGWPAGWGFPWHWYFHNKATGQNRGLEPGGGSGGSITIVFGPTSGAWGTTETPGNNQDKPLAPIPDGGGGCDCINRNMMTPKDPPNFCAYPFWPGFNPGSPWQPLQPPCYTCQTWVNQQLASCGLPELPTWKPF